MRLVDASCYHLEAWGNKERALGGTDYSSGGAVNIV